MSGGLEGAAEEGGIPGPGPEDQGRTLQAPQVPLQGGGQGLLTAAANQEGRTQQLSRQRQEKQEKEEEKVGKFGKRRDDGGRGRAE